MPKQRLLHQQGDGTRSDVCVLIRRRCINHILIHAATAPIITEQLHSLPLHLLCDHRRIALAATDAATVATATATIANCTSGDAAATSPNYAAAAITTTSNAVTSTTVAITAATITATAVAITTAARSAVAAIPTATCTVTAKPADAALVTAGKPSYVAAATVSVTSPTARLRRNDLLRRLGMWTVVDLPGLDRHPGIRHDEPFQH